MYMVNNTELVSQLSPNYRKSWELELKNMDPDVDDTTITWNPINGTAYGAILGGLNLTIAHSTHTPTTTDPEFAIAIDDITATDATTGEVHAVTVGMMVYSYNNGGVARRLSIDMEDLSGSGTTDVAGVTFADDV